MRKSEFYRVRLMEDTNRAVIRVVYLTAGSLGEAASLAVKANPDGLYRPKAITVELVEGTFVGRS